MARDWVEPKRRRPGRGTERPRRPAIEVTYPRAGRRRPDRHSSHRMHNYIVLSLLTGARTEELRALALGATCTSTTTQAGSIAMPPHVEVWRSVRASGDTKTRRSRRTLALPARCVEALRGPARAQEADRTRAERAGRKTIWSSHARSAPQWRWQRSAQIPQRARLVPDINPSEWTPRELRHSFVRCCPMPACPLEEISRLVGHAGTTVTELVYRHQLKPVIQTGATVMDQLFGAPNREPVVTHLVTQASMRLRSRMSKTPSQWVGLSGLEPLTSALSGQRSNRLSYRPARGGVPRRHDR